MYKKYLLIISLIILFPLNSWAVLNETNTGTSGADFLLMKLSPRAVSLGNAFTANDDGDVSVMFFNPAGLSQLNKVQLKTTHNLWIDNTYYSGIAIGYPLWDKKKVEPLGVIGIGMNYLSLGKFDVYKQGSNVEEINTYNNLVQLSYAFETGLITTGITLKYIYEKLGSDTADAFALDLGFLFKSLLEKTSIGIGIENFGTKLNLGGKSDSIPLMIKLGLKLNQKLADVSNLSFYTDFHFALRNASTFNSGIEITLKPKKETEFSIRGGLQKEIVSETPSEFSVSCGFGFNLKGVSIDYSYLPLRYLGATHQMGISISFPRGPKIKNVIEKFYNKGKRFYAENKLVNAKMQFDEVLKLNPHHQKAKMFLSLIEKRIQYCIDPELLFTQGYIFLENKEYEDTIRLWKRVLQINPNHEGAIKYLPKVEKKVKAIEKERTRKEKLARLRRERLLKQRKVKAIEKEIKQIRIKASKLYRANRLKDSLKRWMIIRNIAQKGVKIDKRFNRYLKESKNTISKIKNELSQYYYELGKRLYNKKNYRAAIINFKYALYYNKSNKKIQGLLNIATTKYKAYREKLSMQYYYKGLDMYSDNRMEEAANLWKKAVKLDPNNKEAVNALKRIKRVIKE